MFLLVKNSSVVRDVSLRHIVMPPACCGGEELTLAGLPRVEERVNGMESDIPLSKRGPPRAKLLVMFNSH